MYKKSFVTISILLILSILFSFSVSFAKEYKEFIVSSETIKKGIISLRYNTESNNRLKVMIKKDGQAYYYDISKNETENFPLQMGNGKYNIALLENIEGKKYRIVDRDDLVFNTSKINSVFLNSIQNINWNLEMDSIKKAKELTKGLESDLEKINVIYNYIVNNIEYDYKKIDQIDNKYIPNIEDTLHNKKGICYDYSSLFAAMLRSLDIPTKLVKGYKNDIDVYHAWNEVYIDDKWVIIDTTYDSVKLDRGDSYSMIKNKIEYDKSKEY